MGRWKAGSADGPSRIAKAGNGFAIAGGPNLRELAGRVITLTPKSLVIV